MTPPLTIPGNEFYWEWQSTPLPSDAAHKVPLPRNDSALGIRISWGPGDPSV